METSELLFQWNLINQETVEQSDRHLIFTTKTKKRKEKEAI